MGLVMMQEACSNHNLWFGACSTAYNEASDDHWLAAPLTKSITNKPRALSKGKCFYNTKKFFINFN